MWTIDAREIMMLRGSGGERFTSFMDDLIRCHAYRSQCLPADIVTNQRVNIADGGVDTEIRTAFTHDDTGWFGTPSCWQYKATEYADVNEKELRGEINKRYAKELIARGFGYRLCICDDMPAPTKNAWERILNAAARDIASNSIQCSLLTASDIAAFATRYPALVLQHFRHDLRDALHFGAWGKNAREMTPRYVTVPDWRQNQERIIKHVQFHIPATQTILSISGDAGVGKTRLTYETLASIPGIESLVVYTLDDGAAIRLATALANDERLCAVVVADECSPVCRETLRRLLDGHRHRVRVVTVDNFPRQPIGAAPLPRIEQISHQLVTEVLAQNFATVPVDRRHRYAALSQGFLRFAAHLCRHDAEIAAMGTLIPAMDVLRDAVYLRMPEEDRRCLDALALVTRLGAADDVADEVRDLCVALDMNPTAFVEVASRLKDGTGFVQRGGRYLYVTPEVVAQIAFQSAWQRWGVIDPRGFLDRFPASLLETFQDRVAKSAPEDVRGVVAGFFTDWIGHLRPREIADRAVADRVRALVETDPQADLPRLRRLIEDASVDELRAIRGDFNAGWGARRLLVWLAERLAVFPEFFADAESILFRLAVAESELGIGNNATGVWRQFQRIQLSGTAVPFVERLQVLDARLISYTPETLELLIGGLSETLEWYGGRVAGPAIIAGRVPPQEWLPGSNSEYRECIKAVLGLIGRLAASDDKGLSAAAMSIATKRLYIFLNSGLLDELISLFNIETLNISLLPTLLEWLDDFLLRHGDAEGGHEYAARVREWQRALIPRDLHGRLVATLGLDPWHHRDEADAQAWRDRVDALASELQTNERSFHEEIAWLSSPDARSSSVLGHALALRDKRGARLGAIVAAAAESGATGFARGYVAGVLSAHPHFCDTINDELDRLESTAPLVALDIALVGEERTRAADRVLRLIREGSLPPRVARGLLAGGLWQRIPVDIFVELIDVLVHAIENGDTEAIDAAIVLVGYRNHDAQRGEATSLLESKSGVETVWRLLETTVGSGGRDSHWWFEALRPLFELDVDRASRLACHALVSNDLHQREEAQKCLAEMAKQHPGPVMRALADVMLDHDQGWHFHVDKYDPVIAALPAETVQQWLVQVGTEGSRRIARHLPPPTLDDQGLPTLSPLTEWVLTTFDDDDRTFQEFVAGVGSLEVMTGDIAERYEERARVADAFRNHRVRRIREWADIEARSSRKQAETWRRIDEEDELP